MIIHSLLKALIIPTLILLGLKTAGAIIGYTTAFLFVGILGIFIVYFAIYRQNGETESENFETSMKNILKRGLPLHISTLPLLPIYTLIAAVYCDNATIGNYQAAVNFAAYLTFFTTPINTVMFPLFSRLDLKKDRKNLRTMFRYSVKYAALLSTPVAIATMVLSKPLVSMLFGERYVEASLFLTLYSTNYLYPAFGSLSLGNFLTGQGKTGFSTKLAIISILVGLPMGLLLISNFGILGLLATTIVSALPSLIVGLKWVKKNYDIGIDWSSSAKILLSAVITGFITYFIIEQITLVQWVSLEIQNWTKHIVGGAFFISTYIALIYLLKVIQKSDIYNLRQILGPASVLFYVPFKISKKTKTQSAS
jgi:O-antigen/teichoic acid export membrane protein